MTDAFQNDPLDAARQAYSPLPQMVQRFREMYGGRPAPAPPPNLEQQQQQDRQDTSPDHSKIPEWNQPRRQTLALPPGVPTPRAARFQTFQPASIPRHHSQWGQEEQFPQLPQPFEVPQIVQGLSGYYTQNGGQNLAQIAALWGPFAGQFMQGVRQGQHEKAQAAKEQLALHAAELEERAKEQATAYSDITGEYHALDPTMNRSIKGRGYMDALHSKAVEIGDVGPGSVGDLIEAGAKPSDVIKFLEGRDNRLRDLQKTKTTLEDNAVEDRRWGLSPQPQAASDPFAQYSGQAPSAAPAEPGAPTPAPAAPVDPSTGKPAPAAPPAPKPPGDQTAPDATTQPETPVDAIATSTVRGVEPDAQMAKQFPRAAREGTLRGNEQIAALENIERNPPKDPSQILPAIKKINPSVASDVQSVLDYGMPASGGSSGTGASPGTKAGQYSDRLRNLAQLIDPKWNQGFYQDQQRFRTDPSTQTVLLRTNSLAADGKAVLDDLKYLEDHGRASTGLDLGQIVDMATRDPMYAKLYGDWLAYNDSFNTIVTGGRHVESGAQAQVASAPVSYASPAAFRAAMKGHMNDAYGLIEGEHQRWQTIGGKPNNMPSYNPDTEKQIRDMRDMNWLYGVLPGEKHTFPDGSSAVWSPKGNSLDPHDRNNWQ